MNKKYIFILVIILMPMLTKAQDLIQKAIELSLKRRDLLYLENIRRCGLPKLTDYYCHDYWILEPQNPKPIPKSKYYNQFHIKRSDSLAMELARTSAYMIIKDDSIIYENYFLGYHRNSLMNSFSMAKTVTSLLMGKAIELGYVKSLDEPVTNYLPWLKSPKGYVLRIRDLLNMASGLNWNEDFLNPLSDIVKAYYGYPLDSLIKNMYVKYPPNKRWRYQCVNFVLAGMIIEKASGMNLGEFTQKYLWTPIGAEYQAYWGRDSSSGIFRNFCCLYATPRDYAKLGLMVLHKGYWNGSQIIPQQYVEQMFAPAKQLRYNIFRRVDFYKLGLWIFPRRKYDAYFFAGVYGQYIIILPKYNAVIVRLGQMINQLDVMPIPPDLPLYLKVAVDIIQQYEQHLQHK